MYLRPLAIIFRWTLWSALLTVIIFATPMPAHIAIKVLPIFHNIKIYNTNISGNLINGLTFSNIKLTLSGKKISIDEISLAPISTLKITKDSISSINSHLYGIEFSLGSDAIHIEQLDINNYYVQKEELLHTSLNSQSISINKHEYDLAYETNKQKTVFSLKNESNQINFVKNIDTNTILLNIQKAEQLSNRATGKLHLNAQLKLIALKSKLSYDLSADSLTIDNHEIKNAQGIIKDNIGIMTVELDDQNGNLKIDLNSKDLTNDTVQVTIHAVNNTDSLGLTANITQDYKFEILNLTHNNINIQSLSNLNIYGRYEHDIFHVKTRNPNDNITLQGNFNYKTGNADFDISTTAMKIEKFNISNKLPFTFNGSVNSTTSIKVNNYTLDTVKSNFTLLSPELIASSTKCLLHKSSESKGSIILKKNIGTISYLAYMQNGEENVSAKLNFNLSENLSEAFSGKIQAILTPDFIRLFSPKFVQADGSILLNLDVTNNSENLSSIRISSSELNITLPAHKQSIHKIFFQGTTDLSTKISGQGLIEAKNKQQIDINVNGDFNRTNIALSSDLLFGSYGKETFFESAFKANYTYGKKTISMFDSEFNIIDAHLHLNKIDDSNIEISDDIVFVKRKGEKQASNDKSTAKFVANYKIDINKKPIHLAGYGFDATLKGKLDIHTEDKSLTHASGLLTIHNGSYKALGKIFDINRGSILYLPGTALNSPFISVQLTQRRISQSDKGLSIWLYGPIDKLKANFSHNEHFTFQEDTLNANSNTILAQMANVSGKDIASQIQNMLHLDELSFESSNTEIDSSIDSMVLAVGKQLSKKLYIKYKKSLNNLENDANINAVSLNYKLNDRLSVNLETGSNNHEVSLQFTHDRD